MLWIKYANVWVNEGATFDRVIKLGLFWIYSHKLIVLYLLLNNPPLSFNSLWKVSYSIATDVPWTAPILIFFLLLKSVL